MGRGVSHSRAPEFFAPAPLLAVAVLGLNDHLFKATFHNALTGKLSDFAGCFVLPLFVSAVLAFLTPFSPRARVTVGALATFALFAPIKSSPRAADLVARALETLGAPLQMGAMHIVADPTDLFALPMVALACWFSLTRSHRASTLP